MKYKCGKCDHINEQSFFAVKFKCENCGVVLSISRKNILLIYVIETIIIFGLWYCVTECADKEIIKSFEGVISAALIMLLLSSPLVTHYVYGKVFGFNASQHDE